MSYAQRPMGDYKTYGYAGDPGWLSSIWKSVRKRILPVVGKVLGGPVGTVVGILGGAVAGTAARPPAATPAAPPPGVDRWCRFFSRRHHRIGCGSTSFTCCDGPARPGRVSPGQSNPLEVGA